MSIPRSFFNRDALELAPALLNKVLLHGHLAGRIVEVEAYRGAEDPGSHAFRGRTKRNEVMFGPPGYLYVYFTYGMHWCANVVCGDEGESSAVLMRALAPLAGLEVMRERRVKARSDPDLCNGPAKLCQALGIDGKHNGIDLLDPSGELSIVDDGTASPAVPANGARIGLSAGTDLAWRWWVADDPNVSR